MALQYAQVGNVPPQMQSLPPMQSLPEMPQLNTLQRIGYGLMGVDPFSDYNYNLRRATFASELGMRQSGMDLDWARFNLDLGESPIRMGRMQAETTNLSLASEKLKQDIEDPTGINAILKALSGKTGIPEDTLQETASVLQAVENAGKASQFEKQHALSGLLDELEWQAGAEFTRKDQRLAASALDQALASGLDPASAMELTRQTVLGNTFGMPETQDFGPGGLARLPPGGVPVTFGAKAFEATVPPEDLFSKLSRALGPGQVAPTLASVKARINAPKDAHDARRIGLILRSEGITSAKALEEMHPEKLRVLWQRIEGSL